MRESDKVSWENVNIWGCWDIYGYSWYYFCKFCKSEIIPQIRIFKQILKMYEDYSIILLSLVSFN